MRGNSGSTISEKKSNPTEEVHSSHLYHSLSPESVSHVHCELTFRWYQTGTAGFSIYSSNYHVEERIDAGYLLRYALAVPGGRA